VALFEAGSGTRLEWVGDAAAVRNATDDDAATSPALTPAVHS
jgi:hypothetical protein